MCVYMDIGDLTCAHILLVLLNKLGKRDKMQGLQSILSQFWKEFIKFNNTGAGISISLIICVGAQKSHFTCIFWLRNKNNNV